MLDMFNAKLNTKPIQIQTKVICSSKISLERNAKISQSYELKGKLRVLNNIFLTAF
jgi:hypothetical protein